MRCLDWVRKCSIGQQDLLEAGGIRRKKFCFLENSFPTPFLFQYETAKSKLPGDKSLLAGGGDISGCLKVAVSHPSGVPRLWTRMPLAWHPSGMTLPCTHLWGSGWQSSECGQWRVPRREGAQTCPWGWCMDSRNPEVAPPLWAFLSPRFPSAGAGVSAAGMLGERGRLSQSGVANHPGWPRQFLF